MGKTIFEALNGSILTMAFFLSLTGAIGMLVFGLNETKEKNKKIPYYVAFMFIGLIAIFLFHYLK